MFASNYLSVMQHIQSYDISRRVQILPTVP